MPVNLVLRPVRFRRVNTELYVPDEAAFREAILESGDGNPFWGQVWPAAMALADLILEEPGLVSGKNVLEAGAGLGLPSIIAAATAKKVLATDIAHHAITAISRSAAHHQLKNIEARVQHWDEITEGFHPGIVLLSDVNYAPGNFETLHATIAGYLQQGIPVLLSTPQRIMARDFLLPLMVHVQEQWEREVFHAGGCVPVSIVLLR